MKVKKFLKGLMAAALAVTMAVTPASAVKAAEVTVTSGVSTYTFSQEPVAAFLVTGWRKTPIILYVLPEGTQVHSQAGSSEWSQLVYSTEIDYELIKYMPDGILSESECEGRVSGRADRYSESPYLMLSDIYHSDVVGFDAVYVMENVGWEMIMSNNGYVMNGNITRTENAFDITVIPEIFALNGATAVQIPVADALAMDNANVQLDTANTQTADVQAAQQAAAQAQADAQAAEAAQAQAQADALAAQQAAEAAAQAQITAQQTNTVVSQGTYTVEANDNLCKIAEKVYGDRKAWKEIYKANPTIKSDYVIYRGQVLVIPAR